MNWIDIGQVLLFLVGYVAGVLSGLRIADKIKEMEN